MASSKILKLSPALKYLLRPATVIIFAFLNNVSILLESEVLIVVNEFVPHHIMLKWVLLPNV